MPLFIEQLSPDFAEVHRLASGAFQTALSVHHGVRRLAAEHNELPDYVASDIAGRANRLWQLTNVESVGRAYARVERDLLANVTTARSPYTIALEFSGCILNILLYGIDNESYVRDRTEPFTATSIKSHWPKLLAAMRDLQTPDDDLQEQMQIQVAKANQTSQLNSNGQKTSQDLAADLAEANQRLETEQSTVRQMAATMDVVAVKMSQIVVSNATYKEKLKAIFALDSRYRGKTSSELAVVLGCTDGRVRQIMRELPPD